MWDLPDRSDMSPALAGGYSTKEAPHSYFTHLGGGQIDVLILISHCGSNLQIFSYLLNIIPGNDTEYVKKPSSFRRIKEWAFPLEPVWQT